MVLPGLGLVKPCASAASTLSTQSGAFSTQSGTTFTSVSPSLPSLPPLGRAKPARPPKPSLDADLLALDRPALADGPQRGQYVVDCAGRTCRVVSASRSHCKVQFGCGTTEVLQRAQLAPAAADRKCLGRPCLVRRQDLPKPLVQYPPITPREPADMTTEVGRFQERCRVLGNRLAVWKVVAGNVSALGFDSFVRGLRKLGYQGQLKTLWHELAAGRKELTFADFAPEEAQILGEFRELAVSVAPTLEDFFEQVLDVSQTGRCTRDQFCEICDDLGFQGEPLDVFRLLDLGGEGDITVDEAEMLLMPRRTHFELSAREKLLAARAKRQRFAEMQAETFRQYLRKRHETLAKAWQSTLAPGSPQGVGFQEFCQACRTVGYQKDLRSLWRSLAGDQAHLRFHDLAPDEGAMLDEFRKGAEAFLKRAQQAAEQKGGKSKRQQDAAATLDDVWETMLDTDGSGRCVFSEFAQVCSACELKVSAKQLFAVLDCNHGGDVTIDELAILGMPRRQVKHLTPQELLAEKKQRELEQEQAALQNFRKVLQRRYGSFVAAWMAGFDRDANGVVTFNEFCSVCRDMGFQTNLKVLWRSMDRDDSGSITLDEFIPESEVDELARLRYWLETFFDTVEEAWWCILDSHGTERCSLDNFKKACKQLHFPGDSTKLFRLLDYSQTGDVTLNELEILRMKHLDWSDPAERERATQVRNTARSVLTGKHIFKDLNNFVASKWHKWTRAWLLGMEESLRGTLTAHQFCWAVRNKLGFRGNLFALWQEIDPAGEGEVSFTAVDANCATELDEFTRLLTERYQVLSRAWFELFDPNATGKCKLSDFVSACHQLGYRGDALDMFQFLDFEWNGILTIDALAAIGVSAGEEHVDDAPTQANLRKRLLQRGRRGTLSRKSTAGSRGTGRKSSAQSIKAAFKDPKDRGAFASQEITQSHFVRQPTKDELEEREAAKERARQAHLAKSGAQVIQGVLEEKPKTPQRKVTRKKSRSARKPRVVVADAPEPPRPSDAGLTEHQAEAVLQDLRDDFRSSESAEEDSDSEVEGRGVAFDL